MTGAPHRLRKIISKPIFFSIGLFSLIGFSGLASAQPAPEPPQRTLTQAIQLGPSHCLESETVAQHVQMWLESETLSERVTIEIEDRSDGVHYVVLRDGTPIGSRTLNVSAVPCQQIHAALGLGIAAALDATLLPTIVPETAAPPTEPTLEPVDEPAPVHLNYTLPYSVPSSAAMPPAAAPLEPRRTLRLTATGQAMVLVGVLPEVAVGGGVSFDLELLDWLDFRAGGFATAPVDADVGGGTAEVGLVAGRLDGCVVSILKQDVARVRGCAGFVAGAAQADGNDFDQPRSSTAPWIGPAARVDGRWSFGQHFGMLLSVDGFFPGVKPKLEVEGIQSGETLAEKGFPLAGVVLSLGPSITF